MASMHQWYIDEIKSERGKLLSIRPALFQDVDIACLPAPVKRYLKVCGYIGTPKKLCGQLQWDEARLKMSRTGRWRPIRCYEFLAAPEPLRIVHMTTNTRFLPRVEARDKYQDGQGAMLIKLGGIIKLAEVKGKEMDQSELVTILAEAPLLPAFLLQPYIHWAEVDRNTASATIAYNGVTASGLFSFSDHGEFIRFETGDRWMAKGAGKLRQTPWRATASDYVEDGDIRRPSKFTAAWINGTGIFEYFKGELGDIL